jgi:gluconate 2-dehydrogenase alpha chain
VNGARDFDVVVVGSGPAGSTVADVLSAAGKSVLVLEKGANHLLELGPPYASLGHLSNDEIKFLRRHFLGPDPITEPRTFRRSVGDGERLFVGEVNNLPSTVGGGGFHADAKLPRFRAVDFHTRSEYGPIDGADVVDWPVQYDELEPFYDEAEYLLGVAGEAGANPFAEWRTRPYPMPPGADMYGATLSTAAARELGLHPYPAPTGCNSVPYDGRPACNNCGCCAYFGCPIEAKGDPVAPLRRALQTGCVEVRPESYVDSVVLDATGSRARGVRYLDARGTAHEVAADLVVLGCGAFETPRLLLRSGIGNSSGLVGRYLMYHFQTFVLGIFDHRLHAYRGRSVTHLHDDHLVPDGDALAYARQHDLPWFRGGIVEHGGGGHPIMEATFSPRGAAHAPAMRESRMRDRLWAFTMQGEDLPQLDNRIDLDPSVRDAFALAAGRVTYQPHHHELVASAYYAPLLRRVLERAGAQDAFVATSPMTDSTLADRFGVSAASLRLAPNSKHIMGTCRMGSDPRASVCDPQQRLWDVPNVTIADSSVFPTSAGYGPTLTIVALALRAARLWT